MQALDGKQIDRVRKRLLAEPCLSPLKGDGEVTRKVIEAIHAWISAAGADLEFFGPEHYRDKLPEWRRELRSARYADWLKSRHA